MFFSFFIKPIVHPGVIDVTFQANTKRDIKGAIKTELNIVRSVSGIALPIRCYLASGLYVGSCTYNDGCKDLLQDILNITAANGNCPPPLAAIGIDCSCPFNIPQNNNINLQFPSNIEDLSTSVASFLASGDFKIRLKATGPAPTNEVGCLEFSISMKPASGGR